MEREVKEFRIKENTIRAVITAFTGSGPIWLLPAIVWQMWVQTMDTYPFI